MPCRVMLDQKPMRQVGVLATPDGSQNGGVIAFRVVPIAFLTSPTGGRPATEPSWPSR